MNPVLRFIKFSASTLVGTAVDTGVLWLCAHLWLDGYAGERILAPTISFLAATVANFIVAYFFVWPDRIKNSSSELEVKRLSRSSARDWSPVDSIELLKQVPEGRRSPSIYKFTNLQIYKLYFSYLATCIAGFLVKMLFLQLFSVLLGWDVVWCNLLALCFSGIFNFVVNDRFVFKKK